MEKYLLNLPSGLKGTLQFLAKKRGFTLNGFILEILWKYIETRVEATANELISLHPNLDAAKTRNALNNR